MLALVPCYRLPPNKGFQLTALCARKIGAFLKSEIGTIAFPIYECAAAEAQAVGRVSFRRLSRSRTALSVFLAEERSATPKERIERGMSARCAAWFQSVYSQPRVVRTPVVLYVVSVNAWRQ
jgi:hypothetical protein